MKFEAVASLVAAAFVFSTIGIFGKLLSNYMNPFDVVFGRIFFSFLAISAVVLLRRGWPDFSKKRWQVLGYGFFGFFACTTLFISSVFLTTISNAMFLFSLHPIAVLLLSFKKNRDSVKKDVAYAALAIIGVFLVVGFQGALSTGELLGCLFAILSGMSLGIAVLFAKSVREIYSTDVFVFGSLLYGLPFVVVAFLLFGTPASYIGLPASAWIYVFGISVGCTLGGTYLLGHGLKYVKGVTGSIMLLLEPFFAVPMAMVLFSEVPGVYTLLGGGLILIAAALAIMEEKRAEFVVQ